MLAKGGRYKKEFVVKVGSDIDGIVNRVTVTVTVAITAAVMNITKFREASGHCGHNKQNDQNKSDRCERGTVVNTMAAI